MKKLKYYFNPDFKVDKFFIFAVLFIILNIIDMGLTLFAFRYGSYAHNELSILSNFVSLQGFFIIKSATVISILYVLYRINQKAENRKFVSTGIDLVYGIYSLAILNNIYQIWKVI